jgi:hypothetical protein
LQSKTNWIGLQLWLIAEKRVAMKNYQKIEEYKHEIGTNRKTHSSTDQTANENPGWTTDYQTIDCREGGANLW